MKRILFICTANQIRSPLAAAAFQALARERGQAAEWQVSSAGTWAEAGFPASERAKEAARKLGFEALEAHRSRPVSPALLESADLVIVMERNQKEALSAEFPAQAGKIHLLAAFAPGPGYDIPDPGLGQVDAEDVAREIGAILRRGYAKIEQAAQAGLSGKTG
jgi:protein-tyrosine-phosphatase